MNMTTDIYSSSAIDLVIFTMVDEAEILGKLWGSDLLAPSSVGDKGAKGLALCAVVLPADPHRYPDAAASGKRTLPGGQLRHSETIEQAAKRIAFEQLGLPLRSKLRQVGIFDEPHRDPSGRVISFAYWTMVDFEDIRPSLGGRERIGLEMVNSDRYLRDFDDDSENNYPLLATLDGYCRFGWRDMPSSKSGRAHTKHLTSELPSGRILGLDHDDMVFYAWRALRHAFDARLDPFRYLGVNPLGDEFRLSDLQEFKEVCRGERVPRDAFRREMTLQARSFISPTGKTDSDRPGKPANLYRLQSPPDATSAE